MEIGSEWSRGMTVFGTTVTPLATGEFVVDVSDQDGTDQARNAGEESSLPQRVLFRN